MDTQTLNIIEAGLARCVTEPRGANGLEGFGKMRKKILADQLRSDFKARVERDEMFRALVVSYGGDPDALAANIGSLSDNGAIDAYTTCAKCGSKFWTGVELQRIVEESRCKEDFLARCMTAADGHACEVDWPAEIDAEGAECSAAK